MLVLWKCYDVFRHIQLPYVEYETNRSDILRHYMVDMTLLQKDLAN